MRETSSTLGRLAGTEPVMLGSLMAKDDCGCLEDALRESRTMRVCSIPFAQNKQLCSTLLFAMPQLYRCAGSVFLPLKRMTI